MGTNKPQETPVAYTSTSAPGAANSNSNCCAIGTMEPTDKEPPAKLPVEELDLDALVDSDVWKFVKSKWNGTVRFYAHRRTRRPLCLGKGSSRHDPTMVGVVVFFRPPEAEDTPCQNILMECGVDQAHIMVRLVEAMYSKRDVTILGSKLEKEETWRRFEEAHAREMEPRLLVLSEESKKRKREEKPPEPEAKKAKPAKEEEDEDMCAICMERKANTTTSCPHTVACQECSDKLAANPGDHAANHCVYCNQKITAVFESDGSVRVID